MATAPNKKTATSKTTATTRLQAAAANPELVKVKPAATKAPAKRKNTMTATADATVAAKGAGKARAANAAGAARSAAAKRAEPTAAKKPAAKVPSSLNADMLPSHTVKNLKGLRAVIDQYPNANSYFTDVKFGIDIFYLLNTRGRRLAEVKLVRKAK